MNTMTNKNKNEAFEQVLLSYVEMCYAVALALTHDHDDAHDLARAVISEAWRLREKAECMKDIKCQLLTELRRQFTEKHRRSPRKSKQATARMERS